MANENALSRFFQILGELVTQRRFWFAILVSAFGLVLVLLSYRYETDPARLQILSFVISSVGVAFLVTGVADFVLVEHASRSMRDQTEETLDRLRRDFNIVTSSVANGLIEVFPPRRLSKPAAVTAAIAADLSQARGTIRLMGFSLREFLDASQDLYKCIQDPLRDDVRVDIEVLLLDPFSDASRLRSVCEQGWSVDYFGGQLYSDLVSSVRSLQHFVRAAKQKDRFSIEARFYNIHPPFYMVATEQVLFLEPYHLGRYVGDPPCIGGFVPVFKFVGNCVMHERSWSHFFYIWQSLSTGERPASPSADTWTDGAFLKTRTLEEVAAEIDRTPAPRAA